MRRLAAVGLWLGLTLCAAGCKERVPANHPLAGPGGAQSGASDKPSYKGGQVAGGAVLEGRVLFEGQVARKALEVDRDKATCAHHPILSEELIVGADGGVKNAVVWLVGVKGKPWPAQTVTLDQQGCVYTPHVAVVGAGQPITFVNSDPVIHNVNTFPRENPPLNVSLLAQGRGRPVVRRFRFADEMKVACDSHKWMSAWIVVRDNPYYAVTGEDGRFSITEVPPGEYTMVVWHETLARTERKVTLASNKVLELDPRLRRK